jgi:hypothetical protein
MPIKLELTFDTLKKFFPTTDFKFTLVGPLKRGKKFT